MAYGDGSITEVKRGVYRVRVDFGKDPVTGKRQVVSRNVRGTKRDAAKVRDQIRQEHESGLTADARKVTFSEFLEKWSDYRRTSGRAQADTIEEDRRKLAYIGEFVGDVPLKDFTPEMVESLYAAIRKDKAEKGRSFGNTSMRKLHTLLKGMFKKAVQHDIILRNPFERVDAPKLDEPNRRTLTTEEAMSLLRSIDREEADEMRAMNEKEARQKARGNVEDRTYLRHLNRIANVEAVRIGLATGMRLGEVLALSWGQVDFSAGTLDVSRAFGHGGVLKTPKTSAGKRTVALDAKTAQRLAWWKRVQKAELAKIGIKQSAETPVVVSQRGEFHDSANFQRWWRRFRGKAGFPGLKFHELRHTQATQLLANGVDVKTVQTRLGHSDASLTLNWYAHALPENDRKAADMLGELFAGKRAEAPRIIEFKSA